MKMMVGNTWNAKMKPMLSAPMVPPPLIPSLPKTNSEPTKAKSSRWLIFAPTHSKNSRPHAVFSTISASANWRPRPQTTVLIRMAARLVEHK